MSVPAHADHIIVPCNTLVGLHDATGFLGFKKPSDKLGLQGKVDGAIAKTGDDKVCEATQKLRDYESRLDKLLDADKAWQEHPNTLACIDTALEAFIDESCPSAGDPPRGKGKGRIK